MMAKAYLQSNRINCVENIRDEQSPLPLKITDTTNLRDLIVYVEKTLPSNS